MDFFQPTLWLGRGSAILAWLPLLVTMAVSGAPAVPSVPAVPAAQPTAAPTLAILDPVDLSEGRGQTQYGDFLRAGLRDAGRFQALPREGMEKRLSEFNWRPARSCHEFQCAFDAGNILQSEFIFFGTVTALDGLYAFTFNVLHVPSGQVVHSEAGDVPRKPGEGGDGPLKARLAAWLSALDPARFDLSRKSSRGLMAVVESGPESLESRVLAERVGTHVHASRHYDLMSRAELQELVAAMNIPMSAGATDSGLIALGARLNVAYLVQSRLERDPQGQRLDLALFDVAAKRRIRDWTSKSGGGFKDILRLENRFFTTLAGPAHELAKVGEGKPGGTRSAWMRASLSVLGMSAAAGLAAWAYSRHEDANAAQVRAEAAYSVESAQKWKRAARDGDRGTLLFGACAGLSLAAAVTVWTF
jgi:hypothetical protein